LCHADLTTALPEAVPQPSAPPGPAGTVAAAATSAAGSAATPATGSAADSADADDYGDSSGSDAERVADQLLAQLGVVEGGTGLPPMLGAAGGPLGKVLLVSSVGLAVAAALVSLLALLGWLF
jgi:hypothetical protein